MQPWPDDVRLDLPFLARLLVPRSVARIWLATTKLGPKSDTSQGIEQGAIVRGGRLARRDSDKLRA
jgi:hypothetical protein